ncbi:MAG: branched-chain amino acid ABC transporter permease [Deltaproteobacteria bacterium]|nr:branched-chain amino acid ABC transporter permease [Deltaproteobacteria bacterium]
MDLGLIAQHTVNGLMMGLIYALVAVGFTLFFGVLDIIKFSHGDVLTWGVFTAFSMYLLLAWMGLGHPVIILVVVAVVAMAAIALLGAVIAKVLIIPLKGAPPLNVLLITLMLGTVLRESIRLFYPDGANPKHFPALLPDWSHSWGNFTLRFDNTVMLIAGILMIVLVQVLIKRTKLGMAIRAVSQDEETARIMGINFNLVVYITFAMGSALAAFAGVTYGLYYNEISFNMGLLLGAIGFSAAAVGGFGNIYGAIVGGFLFAMLQTIGAAALPFASAYKDVFAFGVVIVIMAIKPTGLLGEKETERV